MSPLLAIRRCLAIEVSRYTENASSLGALTDPLKERKSFRRTSSENGGCRATRLMNRFNALLRVSMNSRSAAGGNRGSHRDTKATSVSEWQRCWVAGKLSTALSKGSHFWPLNLTNPSLVVSAAGGNPLPPFLLGSGCPICKCFWRPTTTAEKAP